MSVRIQSACVLVSALWTCPRCRKSQKTIVQCQVSGGQIVVPEWIDEKDAHCKDCEADAVRARERARNFKPRLVGEDQ